MKLQKLKVSKGHQLVSVIKSLDKNAMNSKIDLSRIAEDLSERREKVLAKEKAVLSQHVS